MMESVFITIPKKGDSKECTNHRTVALVSHASKILLGRISQKVENEISNEQAGFRKGRGARGQIVNLRILMPCLMQKAKEYRIPLYVCLDFHKALTV